MDTWKIILIVAAVAVVLVLLILVVASHRRKGHSTDGEKTMDDRELISENERAMGSILILAEANEALVDELTKLREQIKYLTPVSDPKVVEFDKKIKNGIEDLRIALVKDGSEDNIKAINALQALRLLVSDRKAKV